MTGVVLGGTVAGTTVVVDVEVEEVVDVEVEDELVVVVGSVADVGVCESNNPSGNVGSVVRDGAVEMTGTE
ncbi:MAG TPA: hypothetical protein VGP92_07305 [Acidimicrobiia bacterium]|nr:hypothetical protein [Acidimicrobiia bacterium]